MEMKNKFKVGDKVTKKTINFPATIEEVAHIFTLNNEIDYYRYKFTRRGSPCYEKEEDLCFVGKRPDGSPLESNDLVRILPSSGWTDIDKAIILDVIYSEKEGDSERQVEGFVLADKRTVKFDDVVYLGTVVYDKEKDTNVLKNLFSEDKDGKE